MKKCHFPWINIYFLANRKSDFTSNFIQVKISLLSLERCKTYWVFSGHSLPLRALQPVTHSFGGLCNVHGRIQLRSAIS
jgi:hypothetical protein